MGGLPTKNMTSVPECECCKNGFHEFGSGTLIGFGGPVGMDAPDKKEEIASEHTVILEQDFIHSE